MKLAGNHFVPVLLLLMIVFDFPAAGQEVITHSLPAAVTHQQHEAQLSWQIPMRGRQYLNGPWELLRTRESNAAVPINVPSTIRNLSEFTLRRTFDLDISATGNYVLHLGVMNGQVALFVNEVLLFEGSSNFLPVSLGLEPQRLKPAGNVIELVFEKQSVTDQNVPGFLPINQPRFDIGLLTGIYLESRPARYIDRVNVVDEREPQGTIQLSSAPDSTEFALNVSYRSKETVYFSQRIELVAGQRSVSMPAFGKKPPPLWSPDSAQQLWVETILDSAGKIMDVFRRPLPRRQAFVKDGFMHINDGQIRLNGVNYVYQNREGSSLFDAELVANDLQDIKSRGFNAIRVIQNPLPEAFYQLCDENGLLCLQDLPIVLPATTDELYRSSLEKWTAQYRHFEYLSRRYNSLVAVGIAFYMDGKSPRQRKMLQGLVQRIGGPTVPRYVSTVLPSVKAAPLVDFQIVDLIDRTNFDRHFESFTDSLRPFMLVPSVFTGAVSYHPDTLTADQERQQQHNINNHLTRQQLPADLKGHFVYTYNDFYLRTPSLQLGDSPDPALRQSGLVTIKRHPRVPLDDAQTGNEIITGLPGNRSSASQNYLYIIIGFVNIFLFLVSYRRYRIFRINLRYSLKKPHGFFVNLSERITIPYKQSLFLMLILAVNGGLVWSAFAFYFRKHLIADYLISFLAFSPSAKAQFVGLFWNQTLSVIVFALAIIAMFYLLAMVIKLFSMFSDSRVSFGQALAASIWAAAPFIILLLLGVIIYGLLQGLKSYWILIAFLLYFHAWYYLRWVNGARVLMDKLYLRTFLLYTVIAGLLFAGIIYLYQGYFNIREHAQWVADLYRFLY